MDLLLQDSLISATTQYAAGRIPAVGGAWFEYDVTVDWVVPEPIPTWQTTASGMRPPNGAVGGLVQQDVRMGADTATVTFTAVEPTRSTAYSWSSGVVFTTLDYDTPTYPGGVDHDVYGGHRIVVGGTGTSLYIRVYNAGTLVTLATITHVSGAARAVEATITNGVCVVKVDGVVRGSPVTLVGGIQDLYVGTFQSNSTTQAADSSPWLKNVEVYGTAWVDPTAFWTSRVKTVETI